jgi:hypothetical protein
MVASGRLHPRGGLIDSGDAGGQANALLIHCELKIYPLLSLVTLIISFLT